LEEGPRAGVLHEASHGTASLFFYFHVSISTFADSINPQGQSNEYGAGSAAAWLLRAPWTPWPFLVPCFVCLQDK